MKKLTLTALALLAGFSASALAAEELRFGVDPTFPPLNPRLLTDRCRDLI
ncbi:hypothetical protein ERHA55_46960 [Erwinia rhapontici]|nr:hypothetical protein ERHA55_46960 [Erwinia rhapontici]